MSFNIKKLQVHRVTVDALVIKQDKVLLLKRKITPFRGKYVLPGGHVEYGEDPKKATLRELYEETGLKGKVVRVITARSGSKKLDPRGPVINICYLVKLLSGRIKLNYEATEIVWWPLRKIKKSTMGFGHREHIENYFKNK